MQNLPMIMPPRAEIKPPEMLQSQPNEVTGVSFQQVLTQKNAQKNATQMPTKETDASPKEAPKLTEKTAHQTDVKPDKVAASTQKKPTKPVSEADQTEVDTAADLNAFMNAANMATTKTKDDATKDGMLIKPSKLSKAEAKGQPVEATLTNASVNDAMIAALNLPPANTSPATATPAVSDGKASQADPAITADVTRQRDQTALKGQQDTPVITAETPSQAATLVAHSSPFNTALDERLAAKLTTFNHHEASTPLPIQSTATFNAQPLAPLVTPANQMANQTVINAYPGKSGWDQAISQKVVWMVGQAEQSATLTLNPPDLGPLQVVIHVNNDKADTTFISDHPEVRKALESGMAHLRQSMDQAGIQLGQTNISDSRQSPQYQQAPSSSVYPSDTSQQAEEKSFIARPTRVRVQQGLVDTFA